MLKIKNFLMILLYSILFGVMLCSCANYNNVTNLNSEEKGALLNNDEVSQIWESKIRFLSETDVPDFDNPNNLKDEYILKLCQYYQTLSDSGLEYDNDLEVYVISNYNVADIAHNILGILDFRATDSKYFNQETMMYEFKEYPDFGYIDREYKMQLDPIDDERQKFIVYITDNGNSGKKYQETYILKKNDKGTYAVVSMARK